MSTLKQVLNDVYAETVTMDDKLTKRANKLVKGFIENIFLEEMKQTDITFNAIFQRIFYTGSFYDGLRVGEATEFDLNIVLNLPFYSGDFQLVETSHKDAGFFDVQPGFTVYCSDKPFTELIPTTHPRYQEYRKLSTFYDPVKYSGLIPGFRQYKYVLIPQKMYSWIEGIVRKTIDKVVYKFTSWIGRRLSGTKFYYEDGSELIEIASRKSGPAHTLNIQCKDGLTIDIDLVPVLDPFFDTVLVPKHSPANRYLWRLSYPMRERDILHSQSCAKKVIKLLKRFRDMQGAPWARLSSYYLKTIVMIGLQNSSNQDQFYDRNIDVIFVQCLQELFNCLEKRKIPFLHDEDCNLLANVRNSTIDNMCGRLRRILKDIEINPPLTLKKYFVVKECTPADSEWSCILM